MMTATFWFSHFVDSFKTIALFLIVTTRRNASLLTPLVKGFDYPISVFI